MYLAAGRRDGVRVQQRFLSQPFRRLFELRLTFLLGTEVLVWIPRPLLLLVFGQGVAQSVGVLQRPLLTRRLLRLCTLAVAVGDGLLWPVGRSQRRDCGADVLLYIMYDVLSFIPPSSTPGHEEATHAGLT